MASRTEQILDAAVAAIGGAPRVGQVEMARAVEHAFSSGEHLLVQAGTGTGKSLGYLAPALAHLGENPNDTVVVATATLALQAQLASSDIPAAVVAAASVTGRTITHAILKGRTNYACLHRVIDGAGVAQDTLLGGEEVAEQLRATAADATTVLGAEVVALREWARAQREAKGVGDRDEAPTHTAAAWAQVSVPTRECLGAQACPFGSECFVERSRETARASQLVVTNHALLAIDAMHGGTALPDHDLVVIDEAHELVSRVTGAASHELSPQQLERVSKRALTWLDDDLGLELLDLVDDLKEALAAADLARIEDPDADLLAVLRRVRDVTRSAVSAMSAGEGDTDRKQAAAAVKEVFDISEAMAALRPSDVLWVSERERFGRWLVLAPLDVSGLMREKVFALTPTVLTSATLKLGGDFESIASSVGLARGDREQAFGQFHRRRMRKTGQDHLGGNMQSALGKRQPVSMVAPETRAGLDALRGEEQGAILIPGLGFPRTVDGIEHRLERLRLVDGIDQLIERDLQTGRERLQTGLILGAQGRGHGGHGQPQTEKTV